MAVVSTLVELTRDEVEKALEELSKNAHQREGFLSQVERNGEGESFLSQVDYGVCQITYRFSKKQVGDVIHELAKGKLPKGMTNDIKSSEVRLCWDKDGIIDGARVKFSISNGKP